MLTPALTPVLVEEPLYINVANSWSSIVAVWNSSSIMNQGANVDQVHFQLIPTLWAYPPTPPVVDVYATASQLLPISQQTPTHPGYDTAILYASTASIYSYSLLLTGLRCACTYTVSWEAHNNAGWSGLPDPFNTT